MHFIFIISSLLLLLLLPKANSLTSEGLALLSLKSAITSDPTHSLSSWYESDPTPCHWNGVSCSDNNQLVTSISLQNLRLTGYISSELGLLSSLRSLDLSRNSLSGRIPDSIGSLQLLSRLDLSSNQLEGSLPESLVELRSLTGTLNLSWNGFSGEIPESYGRFPVRVSLDLGHNNLTGKVPLVGSLVNQGPIAFSGNPSLCGFPLQTPCPESVNVNIPAEESRRRDRGGDGGGENRLRDVEKSRERSGSVAVPLISGVTVVIGAITVSAWLVRRKYVATATEKGKTCKDEEEAKGSRKETNIIVHGDEAMKEEEEDRQNGKFVVMDEGFCLELEDLLRASAYVAGKGRSGILYKVVVGGRGGAGSVVAVRRLNDGGAWRLKEFESEVEAIAKVQHPNIVRLRAYYYASDEKLLVSDFIRNGSLYTALHGGPGILLTPLPWAARLRIAQGAARGIMYIHEYTQRKNVHLHGNLKSTKILLDSELQPYISGFGLTRLVSTTTTTTTMTTSASSKNKQHFLNNSIAIPTTPWNNAYLAPEARALGAKLTQKCDVYAFGIVLMELLTGKLPDAGLEGGVRKAFREEGPLFEVIDESLLGEVGAKTQILAVFHIALSCTEVDPEVRPRMKFVSESLDRIKMAVK